MRTGISYQPITQVLVLTEVEKELDYPVNVKVGLEYQLLQKLTLRAGVATATEQLAFGTGFRAKKLQFDYGFGRQSVLGNLHRLNYPVLLLTWNYLSRNCWPNPIMSI
jgi:hypothetical protein